MGIHHDCNAEVSSQNYLEIVYYNIKLASKERWSFAIR